MYNGIEMKDIISITEKKKLESKLRRKGILYGPVNKHHCNFLNVSRCVKCNVDIGAHCFNNFHGQHV